MDKSQLFNDILDSDDILRDEQSLNTYGRDSSRKYLSEAGLALLPRSEEQIQAIVKRCRAEKIAIVPSGGRTGLCGGASAERSEVVVALDRMRKIEELSIADQMVRVQAGVPTGVLKQHVEAQGLDLPVSFASQGSSQIGGNIATNVGGIHVLRYGHIRNWVMALRVVTGEGEILSTGKPLRKDNTGYDLKSLFIGSEGTLGLITEATLALAEKPKSLHRVVCGMQSIEDMLELLRLVRVEFEDLNAFEFFTDRALKHVTSCQNLRNPFQELYPYYALVELSSDQDSEQSRREEFFMSVIEKELALDVVISSNSKQSAELMELREWIGETLNTHFVPYKNDISVPVSSTPEFCKEVSKLFEREEPDFELVLFGHLGDGNIHLNWLKPEAMERAEFFERSDKLNQLALELVASFGGSVSAEHGIGLLKRDQLSLSRSQQEIQYMRQIKAIFDPDGIMNPRKIFPQR